MNEQTTHEMHRLRQEGLLKYLKRTSLPSNIITIFHSRLSINRQAPVRFSCKELKKGSTTMDLIEVLAKKQILIIVFDEMRNPVLWTSIPGTAVTDPSMLFNEEETGNGRWHIRFSTSSLIGCLKPVQGQSQQGQLFKEENITLTQFIERQV